MVTGWKILTMVLFGAKLKVEGAGLCLDVIGILDDGTQRNEGKGMSGK